MVGRETSRVDCRDLIPQIRSTMMEAASLAEALKILYDLP